MKSRDRINQSPADREQFAAATELFMADVGDLDYEGDEQTRVKGGFIDLLEAIEAFPRYVSRSCLSKFLSRYEIFKRILPVHGSIVECGVLHGAGLFTWAKLSSIFEPSNHTRKIVGFDTFEGFPSLNPEKDAGTPYAVGDLRGLPLERMEAAVACYDINRPLSHIPKIELVKGDLATTAEEYVSAHPELIVSMLYLDVDLYDPTLAALEAFVPLMPRGGIIVFDEAGYSRFPGETQAMRDFLKSKRASVRLERHPWQSMVSFAVVE